MFDYHIHSARSFDGKERMEAYARAALAKGLGEICFTEHLEIDYPYEGLVGETVVYDYAAYRAEIEQVRADVPELDVKMGMEAGLIGGSLHKFSDAARGGEYDFVIASQHVVEGRDPFYGSYFDGWTLRYGQRAYLEELHRNIVAFDGFDVVGHLGYVDKYLTLYPEIGEALPFDFEDFPELIDAILRSVITRGKGIEVNTSSFGALGWPLPRPGVIRRFVELGGEVLTMGSDAHAAADVGQSFNEVRELLLECGVKYVCTFTKRKAEFHSLREMEGVKQ